MLPYIITIMAIFIAYHVVASLTGAWPVDELFYQLEQSVLIAPIMFTVSIVLSPCALPGGQLGWVMSLLAALLAFLIHLIIPYEALSYISTTVIVWIYLWGLWLLCAYNVFEASDLLRAVGGLPTNRSPSYIDKYAWLWLGGLSIQIEDFCQLYVIHWASTERSLRQSVQVGMQTLELAIRELGRTLAETTSISNCSYKYAKSIDAARQSYIEGVKFLREAQRRCDKRSLPRLELPGPPHTLATRWFALCYRTDTAEKDLANFIQHADKISQERESFIMHATEVQVQAALVKQANLSLIKALKKSTVEPKVSRPSSSWTGGQETIMARTSPEAHIATTPSVFKGHPTKSNALHKLHTSHVSPQSHSPSTSPRQRNYLYIKNKESMTLYTRPYTTKEPSQSIFNHSTCIMTRSLLGNKPQRTTSKYNLHRSTIPRDTPYTAKSTHTPSNTTMGNYVSNLNDIRENLPQTPTNSTVVMQIIPESVSINKPVLLDQSSATPSCVQNSTPDMLSRNDSPWHHKLGPVSSPEHVVLDRSATGSNIPEVNQATVSSSRSNENVISTSSLQTQCHQAVHQEQLRMTQDQLLQEQLLQQHRQQEELRAQQSLEQELHQQQLEARQLQEQLQCEEQRRLQELAEQQREEERGRQALLYAQQIREGERFEMERLQREHLEKARKEWEQHEIICQEMQRQELIRQEMMRQEMVRQEKVRQERERQERERQERERQERERQERERQEMIHLEMVRQELMRQEQMRLAEERFEQERREEERLNLKILEMGRQNTIRFNSQVNWEVSMMTQEQQNAGQQQRLLNDLLQSNDLPIAKVFCQKANVIEQTNQELLQQLHQYQLAKDKLENQLTEHLWRRQRGRNHVRVTRQLQEEITKNDNAIRQLKQRLQGNENL